MSALEFLFFNATISAGLVLFVIKKLDFNHAVILYLVIISLLLLNLCPKSDKTKK
jgi:hypothetical protein